MRFAAILQQLSLRFAFQESRAGISRQDFDAFMLGRLVHVNALYGIGIDEYRRAMKLLGADSGDGPSVTPRYTIANLASDAIDAIDQGDDDAARAILDTIRNMPLAQ